ncbi:MAG: hypothetical protein QOI55_3102 [Actinomycetota bacterium]|nr:hypothetical protein [Actinomycetota bacterium]
MPVRNAAGLISEQLAALAAQDYDGEWELVVADNGSTDDTLSIARRWEDRLPRVTVVDASGRTGPSFARNRGAGHARGDFLAFCDADDVVTPSWLRSLAAGARDFDAVTGVQDARRLNSEAVQAWRPPRANGLPGSRSQILPYAPSCNLGVWAEAFQHTGGFDEEYPAGEDVEWSWRFQLAAFTLGFAPDAVVHYRYRTSMRGILRQAYLSGVAAARLYRDYRDRGVERPSLLRALRTWLWLVVRSPYVLTSANRGTWARRAGEAAGRVAGSVRFRVLFL